MTKIITNDGNGRMKKKYIKSTTHFINEGFNENELAHCGYQVTSLYNTMSAV